MPQLFGRLRFGEIQKTSGAEAHPGRPVRRDAGLISLWPSRDLTSPSSWRNISSWCRRVSGLPLGKFKWRMGDTRIELHRLGARANRPQFCPLVTVPVGRSSPPTRHGVLRAEPVIHPRSLPGRPQGQPCYLAHAAAGLMPLPHERITARSSRIRRRGSQSLIHRPLCPWRFHWRWLARMGDSFRPWL